MLTKKIFEIVLLGLSVLLTAAQSIDCSDSGHTPAVPVIGWRFRNPAK